MRAYPGFLKEGNMFTRRFKLHILIIIASACFLTGSAQDKPAPKDPVFVENKGFEGKVFEIKYRDPYELVRLLTPLGSGFKGATLSYSSEFKSLSVRDFPENIVAIEAAIKRLDVATTASSDPDIDIEMHVLMATNIDGATSQSPASLKDVIKQLQSTLSYKNYFLVTSIVQRAKIRTGFRFNGRGIIEIPPPFAKEPYSDGYTYGVGRFSQSQGPSGAPTIQLENFGFTLQEPNGMQAEISTSLGVREGEKVVVGTASLKDKAIILVLSVKVVK
jgi:hypothetical protein